MFADSELRIDLVSDWTALLRTALSNLGHSPPAEDSAVGPAYFNLLRRRVVAVPRRVHVASTLSCPTALRDGFEVLVAKVERGDDITAHLSTRVRKLDDQDGLLNDWGIHHLHLGTELGRDGFVRRTGPLVFARFTATDAYFIAIAPHGTWADTEMLEIVRREWPETMAPFEFDSSVFRSFGPQPTATELIEARKHGVQTLVSLADGTVVYPPGGGVTTARTSSWARARSDSIRNTLRGYEDLIVANRRALVSNAIVRPMREWPIRLELHLSRLRSGAYGASAVSIANGLLVPCGVLAA